MIRLNIFILILITTVLGLSCADEIPVNYDNPRDPYSSEYIPSAPYSLDVNARSDTGIVISWKIPSYAEEGFKVFRKVGFTGSYKQIAVLPAKTTSYVDLINLADGVTYFYKVASFNENTEASYSPQTYFTFEFPEPQSVTFGLLTRNSAELQLNYDSDLTTSTILEKSVNGEAYIKIAELPKGIYSYTDTEIDTLHYYSYRIKLISKNNESDYSSSSNIVYAPTDLKKVNTLYLGKTIHNITFSNDGSMIAATGRDYAVKVWETSTGKQLWDFSYKGGFQNSNSFQAAFSSDGRLFAANTETSDLNEGGAIVKIWNLDDGTIHSKLTGSGLDNPASLCFSRDNTKLFTADYQGNLASWNVEDSKLIKKVNATTYWGSHINMIYASKDGGKIFTGVQGSFSLGQIVQTWNADNLMIGVTYGGKGALYYSVSHNEKYFAAGGDIFSFTGGNELGRIPDYNSGQTCFSSDDALLLTRSYKDGIRAAAIVNTNIGISKSVYYPDYTSPAIASSGSSNLFAIAGAASGSVELWTIVRVWKQY